MFRRLVNSLMLSPPASDEIDHYRRFEIPANRDVLPRFSGYPSYPYSQAVRRIEGRKAVMRPLLGHPDLHRYLWFEAGANIPSDCRWVVCGIASFAHPETNIIFAIATGSHELSVRVPQSELPQFAEMKSEVDNAIAESVWIKSRLRVDEDQRLLALAHRNASSRPGTA
ncbi:MAG: hypothetical protein C0483_04950 [Pirellula sp.]|nr:hypothetical protein [Pirellula sp.]